MTARDASDERNCSMRAACEASQSEMRLVVGTLAVQRILALTGIDRLLDVYPSVAAALAVSPDPVDAAVAADIDGGAA